MRRGAYHNCVAPGCGATIGRAFLMCRTHWHQVPRDLQRAVLDTWQHGAGVLTAAYRDAVRAAVASLPGSYERDERSALQAEPSPVDVKTP